MFRVRQLLAFLMLCACAGQASGPAGTVPSSASAPPKSVDYYALPADEFFKRPEPRERIKKDSFDQALLDAAIFQQTNRERVANKLPILKHSNALQLMARRHSQEMSDLQFFEHTSPTAANRTLGDRLRNVGLVNVTAGENIAVLPAKEMGSGHYLVKDNPDGSETWIDEANGKQIDYYTYEELSKAVVTQWMNSPAHHANMVNKAFIYLGVGAARGPYSDLKQDSFYMTQNFSATITPASEEKAKGLLQPAARGK
ncbi:MAG TPA: CAP domain-containing protein [Phycisphaerae bacterium]|nr:CAP domain-containing protein [Phycisphaerae bacterium]